MRSYLFYRSYPNTSRSIFTAAADAGAGSSSTRVRVVKLGVSSSRKKVTKKVGLAMLLGGGALSMGGGSGSCDEYMSVGDTSKIPLFMPLAKRLPSSSSSGDDGNDEEILNALMDKYGALASQVSYGSFLGYCAGYASKQIGKRIAALIGTGYIALQAMAYSGYIDVKWGKVSNDFKKIVDADGDGKITKKDALVYYKKAKSFLTFNLPSSSGFGLGFLVGLAG
ncbi:hypothetical protein TrCOL_g9574 [Triparma columacea]|uniref:EF-hand domain-containing protein n=1 Tax=Triparma columacea TaxID=722753 RepID=A0A9W7GM01_9STRA|nr:hypothetical protein TrCOL_g9574 [Triparma columacea]